MPFCPSCGNEYHEETKFCSACGQSTEGKLTIANQPSVISIEENVIWQDKPAGLKARIKTQVHLNPTTYILTNLRLIIRTSVIRKKEVQIELIRIKDLELIQGLKDRALGVGDILVLSTDDTEREIRLVDIKNPSEVKDVIWKAVRAERQRHVRYIGDA